MKKFITLSLIAAVICSCSKEYVPSEEQEASQIRYFTAVFESTDTKTSLNEDGVTPEWKVADKIWLSNGSTASYGIVTAVTADSNGKNTFATIKTALPSSTLYAVYPYTAVKDPDKGTATPEITFPEALDATVSASEDGDFQTANICAAKTGSDGKMHFKNVGGIIKITTTQKNMNIELPVHGIAGDYSLTIGDGEVSTTLVSPKEELTLTTSLAKTYYVPVPAGISLKGYPLVYRDNNGLIVGSNRIYKPITTKASKFITFNGIYENGQYMSASETKRVVFSGGNLRAKKNEEGEWAWGFYENQYDYNSLSKGKSSRTVSSNDNEIDLFCWGYDPVASINPLDATERTSKSAFTDWGCAFGGSSSPWGTLDDGSDGSEEHGEWLYLLTRNCEEGGTYGYIENHYFVRTGVTVCGEQNCLVIAPDNNDTEIQESYDETSWAAAEAKGFVCFPLAGHRERDGGSCYNFGSQGFYWTTSYKGYWSGDIRAKAVYINDIWYSLSTEPTKWGGAVRLVVKDR